MGPPEVILKVVEGRKQEPIEQLVVSVEDHLAGSVIESVSGRKGMLTSNRSEN